MAFTISSPSAVLMLAVAGVFSTPQQIQNFGVDDAFDTEAIDLAETQMSIDGFMSSGRIFVPVKMNITVAASSLSNDFFETWNTAGVSADEVLFANGTLALPSVGRKYAMSGGVLMNYAAFADGKKVLQPRKYGITWERVTPAPN